MVTAYLGLGSNLGNRLAFMRGGRDSLLTRFDIVLRQASGVYETEAVGGPPDNPPFFNAVLEIETGLSPRDLLAACLNVEDEFGRTRPMDWAPRTLDIDLLLYGDQTNEEPELLIPHPLLHERGFVLAPLSEIAPELRHPLIGKTMSELLAELSLSPALVPVRPTW